MSATSIPLQQSTIRGYAKQLRLPTLGGQFARLAEQAIKEKQSHVSYLEALLAVELEEREHNTVTRRIQEAHLPKVRRSRSSNFRRRHTFPRRSFVIWPRVVT